MAKYEKVNRKRKAEKPVAVGSHQAVEAAIDATKVPASQPWDSATARLQSVPPWTHGNKKKRECNDK